MHLTLVAGARPNFIKISALINAILQLKRKEFNISFKLVHTGQHFDKSMSDSFFEDLNIPVPDINLGAGGGSHAEQTAAVMIAFEKYLIENKTDIVIVVGDVTSTMACAIVAKKLNVKLAHVEAGIRSYDNSMPEEINRKVTDSIANFFFTTTQNASNILLNEGHKEENIFFVGNVMIDTLFNNIVKFKEPDFYNSLQLKEKEYLVLTLHRPNNVDDIEKLKLILSHISDNTKNLLIVFPAHPRTTKILNNIKDISPKIQIVSPMGYLEFMFLIKNCLAVITDSGGITEETTVLGIPCLTLRDNTERPETCDIGTNELIGSGHENIKFALQKLFEKKWKTGKIPELWDGHSSERIINQLLLLKEKGVI